MLNIRETTYLFGVGVGMALMFLIANHFQVSTLNDLRYSRSLIDNYKQVESLLADAETGQRGYLLTGNKKYLEPFDRAAPRIASTIDTLKQVAKPQAKQTIARVDSLSQEKLKELQLTIDLEEQGKHSAALSVVEGDRGREIMDEVRQIVDSQVSQESISLQQKRDWLVGVSNYGVPLLITISLAVFVYIKIAI